MNPTNNDSPEELANLKAKRSLDKSEASVGYVHIHQKCLKCDGCIYECEHQLKTTMTSTGAPGLMYVDGSRANASPLVSKHSNTCTCQTVGYRTFPCPVHDAQQGSESTKLDDILKDLGSAYSSIDSDYGRGVTSLDQATEYWNKETAQAKAKLLEWSRQERADELEHIDNPAQVNLYWNGLISVIDRIKALQSPQEER